MTSNRKRSKLQSVNEEVLLFLSKRSDCFEAKPKIISPSEQAVDIAVAEAFDLAKTVKDSRRTHLIAGFSVIKRITARVDGHKLENIKPIILHPQSYFGEVRPVTAREKKHGFKQFDFAAKAITGETIMLAPGELVYDLGDDARKPFFVTPRI